MLIYDGLHYDALAVWWLHLFDFFSSNTNAVIFMFNLPAPGCFLMYIYRCLHLTELRRSLIRLYFLCDQTGLLGQLKGLHLILWRSNTGKELYATLNRFLVLWLEIRLFRLSWTFFFLNYGVSMLTKYALLCLIRLLFFFRKTSFTDTASFTLRYGVCQIGVVG